MAKRTQLTDAERVQRRAADRQFVQQAVEQLRTSDGWQRWVATRRHFHTYSLRNQLLLAMQNPDATRVAGFKAWLALGYCVRRGEKALRIFAPCPPSKAKLKAWRDAGADPAEKPRTFFRLTAVFDTLSRVRSLGHESVVGRTGWEPGREVGPCRAVARVRSRGAATIPCRGARGSAGDPAADGQARGPAGLPSCVAACSGVWWTSAAAR
jgi:hypothetical protein